MQLQDNRLLSNKADGDLEVSPGPVHSDPWTLSTQSQHWESRSIDPPVNEANQPKSQFAAVNIMQHGS